MNGKPTPFRRESWLSSHVKDRPRGLRKPRQTLAVYPVIHKSSATLRKHKPGVPKNFQMMRYRRLLNRKMLHNLADADRLVIVGQQVENANTNRIGKGLEATGVALSTRLGDPGRLYLRATIGSGAFCGSRHGDVDGRRVPYSSKNVNESIQWRLAVSANDGINWRRLSKDFDLIGFVLAATITPGV